MIREIKELLFAVYEACDNYDRIRPNYEYRSQDIAKASFGKFMLYLFSQDGYVTAEECAFIENVMDWQMTPDMAVRLIKEQGINNPEFAEKAPMFLKLAFKMDEKLNADPSTCFSRLVISIFDSIGKLSCIADNEATLEEFNAFEAYMDMLIKHFQGNFKNSNTRIYFDNYLSAVFNPNDDEPKNDTPVPELKPLRVSDIKPQLAEAEENTEDIVEDTYIPLTYPSDTTREAEEYKPWQKPKTKPVVKQTPKPTAMPSHKKEEWEDDFVMNDDVSEKDVSEYGRYTATPVNEKPQAADDKSLQELMAELDSLLGLHEIKKEVHSLINFMNIMKLRERNGMKRIPTSLHLVFSGNPGTGKTTVARLLARLYQKIGVLSKGHLVEVQRSDLVAGYVGQTAVKTMSQIRKAMGGVLFIDEAYTLVVKGAEQDYGQEAINTILKAMEDNRDDFVVIVAGYTDLMKDFVNSNPGLKSRFNKFLNFADYEPEELAGIFDKFCRDNQYTASADVKEYVKDFFTVRYMNRTENFANGRDVRNFFEKAIVNQANRLAMVTKPSKVMLTELILDDVKDIYLGE